MNPFMVPDKIFISKHMRGHLADRGDRHRRVRDGPDRRSPLKCIVSPRLKRAIKRYGRCIGDFGR